MQELRDAEGARTLRRGTVNHTDNITDEWSPIARESMGEALWKIACGKK